MTTGVFPQSQVVQPAHPMMEPFLQSVGGLTKRELFAMSCLNAFIIWNQGKDPAPFLDLPVEAVIMADVLLAALERRKP